MTEDTGSFSVDDMKDRMSASVKRSIYVQKDQIHTAQGGGGAIYSHRPVPNKKFDPK